MCYYFVRLKTFIDQVFGLIILSNFGEKRDNPMHFGLNWGVLGIPRVDQKSSTNPCLLVGTDFVCITLLLPLSILFLAGRDPSKVV